MDLSAHIDWISITARQSVDSGVGKGGIKRFVSQTMPLEIGVQNWISAKAQNGYTVAMRSETGITVMSNPDRKDMGVHIVMSGSTLAKNEEMGIASMDIIKWAFDREFSITRVDYAIDAKDAGLRVESLAEQIDSGQCKTRVRSAPYIDDKIRKGKTQYLGSLKNRTKLLRIYDKAIDLGIDGDWKRIELELHGQHAKNSAAMAQNGGNLQKTIQSLIKAFADFPNDEIWQSIIGSDEIWLSVPEVKQGNTEQWLLTQCAPALAKILDLDEGFMYRFMEKVSENREAL